MDEGITTRPPARAFTDTRQFKIMRTLVGAANPLITRLLGSRFAGPLAGSLLLLRYQGRRSGRTYTTPVGYAREGEGQIDRQKSRTHLSRTESRNCNAGDTSVGASTPPHGS